MAGGRAEDRLPMGTLRTIALLLSVTLCFTLRGAVDAGHGNNEHHRRRHTLAKCRYDSDCMENAYCLNQVACFCKDEYIVYKNRTHVQCLKVATSMGDPCIADVQCRVTFAPHSECRDNTCQCSDGARFEEGRCYESVGLGHVCQTHHNCYVKDSYCVSGYCACTLQHHPSSDNGECLKSAYLGDHCISDDECVAENSRCTGTCVCKVDHVLSGDGGRCLKAANSVGEACQEDSQCTAFLVNSACGPDGACSCLKNFHRRGSACLRSVALGHRCVRHQECVTSTYKDSNSTDVMNVDCIEGSCTCAEDYAITEELNDCIRYSDSGAVRWRAYGILSIIILAIL